MHVKYDNLTSAVTTVLFGTEADGDDHWVLFGSFYQFDASYCLAPLWPS